MLDFGNGEWLGGNSGCRVWVYSLGLWEGDGLGIYERKMWNERNAQSLNLLYLFFVSGDMFELACLD
jgi:hypothetical protein